MTLVLNAILISKVPLIFINVKLVLTIIINMKMSKMKMDFIIAIKKTILK